MTDEQYYKELRLATYRATEEQAPRRKQRLTEIDLTAVQAAAAGGYTWAWDDDENADIPSRFEVAVWEGSSLTGLCRGKPIEDDSKLCLEITEASPSLPLSKREPILPIISACATTYARIIGAVEIRLTEPTSASRVRLYARLGYTYVAEGNYLVKRLT